MTLDPDALDRHITGNYGEGNGWDDSDLDDSDIFDADPEIEDDIDPDEDTRDFDSMPGGADWEEYDAFYEDYYPDDIFEY